MWADLGTPRLSFRRFALLLERAPRDSEYVRSKAGPAAEWGDTEHLLAVIADLIAATNYQFATAHRNPRKSPPEKPTPIPRPTDRAKRQARRTQLSGREIARRLIDLQRREKRRR